MIKTLTNLNFLKLQNFTINYWMELGAPRDKLVLGMPLYGRCWKLDDVQNDSGYFASGRKPTKGGPYTNEPGLMGYNEVSTINLK